jgi:hypothetical protein
MSLEEITKNINFAFPFKPYDIQLDFARNLYFALSTKKFSILESPTGTVIIVLIIHLYNPLREFQKK